MTALRRVMLMLLAFSAWLGSGVAFAAAAAGVVAHYAHEAGSKASEMMNGRRLPEPLLAESEAIIALFVFGVALLFSAVAGAAASERRQVLR